MASADFFELRRREPFAALVRRQLAFLFDEHGFEFTEQEDGFVRLESPALGARIICDPRGEIDVYVFRRGHEESAETWSYEQVGGDLRRLLEIAGERLRAEDVVLRADRGFFKELGKRNKSESEARTAYYSGRGPAPRRGKLP